MLFKYTGFDKDGNKVINKVEATTLSMAKQQLKQNQIIYIKINEDKYNIFELNFLKGKTKLKSIVLSRITRDLSIYLNSGISLLNAIKLLSTRYKNDKKLNPFFISIISYLDEGKNLYTSLVEQRIIKLPEFYLQSIKISEDSGILQTVLIELSDYLKEQDKINKQISSAMVYPMFIIVVSLFMVAFMLSFIVPKITTVFEQNEQKLPPLTQFVIDAGNIVINYYPIMIFLFISVILVFIFMMKNNARFKYFIDAFILKVPFIGKLIEIGELSRFSYMNSILIRSGIPIVQSFKLGSNIIKNSVIKKLFITASADVVEGKRLSMILDKSNVYKVDIAFIQAISIGEETSTLSIVLENLTELYTTQNKDKIAIFLTLLEPMLMLIVGALIGFIVLAMLLPIFSMSLG